MPRVKSNNYYILVITAITIGALVFLGAIEYFLGRSIPGLGIIIPFLAARSGWNMFQKNENRDANKKERNSVINMVFLINVILTLALAALAYFGGAFDEFGGMVNDIGLGFFVGVALVVGLISFALQYVLFRLGFSSRFSRKKKSDAPLPETESMENPASLQTDIAPDTITGKAAPESIKSSSAQTDWQPVSDVPSSRSPAKTEAAPKRYVSNDPNEWQPFGSIGGRMIYQSFRVKWLWGMCLAFIAFIALIFIYINQTKPAIDLGQATGAITAGKFIIWILAAIAALLALYCCLNFFSPATLTLNRRGIEEKSLFGRKVLPWTEVSDPWISKLKNGTKLLSRRYDVTLPELADTVRQFRDQVIEETGLVVEADTVQSAQNWQKVTAADITDGYDVGEEKTPWLQWALSAILLSLVAGGAIWLGTMVVQPDARPDKKIDLVAEEPGEDAPPPKSADEQAWIDALEKDTLEGYREYIEAFPNGRFVDKAQAEIDKYDDKAWATAEQRNTIAGYEDYLTDWPEGKYASKAKERIDEMKKAIEAAKKDAAEKAEAARQAAIARAAEERQAWSIADAANTVPSYQAYLAKFPSGKNAAEAQSRIDRMLATEASAQASAIEEQAWTSAKTSNTAESYQTYLSSYPNGKYSALAKAALEELRPSPGRTYQDCNVCPNMKTLDSGNAQLGAQAGEPGVKPNEQPQRPVIISTPFSISISEVTFTQWDACVADGGCSTRPNDNGWGRGNRPVINVSWDDAQGYAQWLSNKTGKKYSLPSEAQWEYAARGGETGIYIGGSAKALCAFANGAGSESGLTWANKECSDLSSDRTLPVGSLSANKYGLKDMLGNVQEWTLDCNTLNLKDAPTNGEPDLRGSCNQRVVRGGSWFSPPTGLRFTTRENQRRGDSNDFTGFRVVRN